LSKAMSTDLHAAANMGWTGVIKEAPTSRDPLGFPASLKAMILSRTISICLELLNASWASLK
jgi:hypothetical protein